MKLLATLMLLPVLAATANAQEFQSLFNGKDLSGWAGKTEFWSVKDGAIFGQTTKDKPTKGNTFLVWQEGEVVCVLGSDLEMEQVVQLALNAVLAHKHLVRGLGCRAVPSLDDASIA